MQKRAIKYLDYFRTIEYDFTGRGEFNTVVDITKSVVVEDSQLFENVEYLKYQIPDYGRPDSVAQELYGDPKWYWVLFLFNKSLRSGLEGWPLSATQFDTMVEKEYNNYSFICPEPTPKLGDTRHPEKYFYSNLSLPQEYYNDIDIYVKDNNGDFKKSDLVLDYYEQNKYGLIFKKGKNNYINDLGIGSKTVTKASQIESLGTLYIKPKNTLRGSRWFNEHVYGKYPTIELDDSDNLVPFYYNIKLSHEFLGNAAWQYFIGDPEDGNLKSHFETAYDAIYGEQENDFESADKLPNEITYIEYENILNNRKKEILVPKIQSLPELERSFVELLKR